MQYAARTRPMAQLRAARAVLDRQESDQPFADRLRVGAREKARIGEAAAALVQDGMKTLPSVTRVFRAAREMYVYLEAYQQGPEEGRPLSAYVTFYRDGAKVWDSPPVTATPQANRLRTTPLRFQFPLTALPPGESMASTTLWTLRWPESGALRERALGWSHPHGRWVGGWRGDVNGCEAGPA